MQNDGHKQRLYIGEEYVEVMDLPNLVDIQLLSYEKFLQREILKAGADKARNIAAEKMEIIRSKTGITY